MHMSSDSLSREPAPRVPSYRRHKPTGQAVVTLNGRDIYLGKWNTKASRTEYDRLIGEWLAAGRCHPRPEKGLTVAELALAYWRFARGYYVRDGRPTETLERIKVALRCLRASYAHTLAEDFGPLAFQAIQQTLAGSGRSRPYCNNLMQTIRRVFKWAVSQELLPESVYRALATVPGLRKGRTEAPEPAPVLPVADAVVDATLPYLPAVVADMVRVQRMLGCRPGEVCMMRPGDIDRTGEVWEYRPASHKTEHRGRQRSIFIGPKAQEVLLPYLLRDTEDYCFAPADSERKRKALMRANRKTPVQPSQRNRRKRRPKRKPGARYTSRSYTRAINRAIVTANAQRIERCEEPLPHWHPNQLRHSAATDIRRQFGLEAAQVVLGHSRADVTQVYAERDLQRAKDIMRKIG